MHKRVRYIVVRNVKVRRSETACTKEYGAQSFTTLSQIARGVRLIVQRTAVHNVHNFQSDGEFTRRSEAVSTKRVRFATPSKCSE